MIGGIIKFGPGFGVGTLNILADHDKGHEMDLNEIGNKQPEDKGRVGIKAQRGRGKHVPGQPRNGPKENDEEKAHGAYFFCGKNSQFFQRGKAATVDKVGITQGQELFADVGDRTGRDRVGHVYIYCITGI